MLKSAEDEYAILLWNKLNITKVWDLNSDVEGALILGPQFPEFDVLAARTEA